MPKTSRQKPQPKLIDVGELDIVMSHWDWKGNTGPVTRSELIERCQTLSNLDHVLVVRYDEGEDILYFSALPEKVND